MKVERKIFIFSNLILITCFLFSCKKENDYIIEITKPNDSIKGLVFGNDNGESIGYSPKGTFILSEYNYSGIWREIFIKKSKELIEPKLFYHDDLDKVSYLQDSLSLGNYEIKYVSCLKDTIREKLLLNNSIKLKFSKKLSAYYEKISIKKFEINNLRSKDTLQFLYEDYGCFGGGSILIEFIIDENSNMSMRKLGGGMFSEVEKGNKWSYLKMNNAEEKLQKLFFKVKNIVNKESDYCSSKVKYSFRKKGTNKIAIVENKSCKSIHELSRFLNDFKNN